MNLLILRKFDSIYTSRRQELCQRGLEEDWPVLLSGRQDARLLLRVCGVSYGRS